MSNYNINNNTPSTFQASTTPYATFPAFRTPYQKFPPNLIPLLVSSTIDTALHNLLYSHNSPSEQPANTRNGDNFRKKKRRTVSHPQITKDQTASKAHRITFTTLQDSERNSLHRTIQSSLNKIIITKIRSMNASKLSLWETYSDTDSRFPVDVALEQEKGSVALEILMANPEISQSIIIDSKRHDILFTALKKITSKADFFFETCLNNILSFKSNGETLLHRAVLDNTSDTVAVIAQNCPQLLSEQDTLGNTPLMTLLRTKPPSSIVGVYTKVNRLLNCVKDINLLQIQNQAGETAYSMTIKKGLLLEKAEIERWVEVNEIFPTSPLNTSITKDILLYCLFGLDAEALKLSNKTHPFNIKFSFTASPKSFNYLASNHFDVAKKVFDRSLQCAEQTLHAILREFHFLDVNPINKIDHPIAKNIMLLAFFNQVEKIPLILSNLDVYEARKIFIENTNGLPYLIESIPEAADKIISHLLSKTDSKNISISFLIKSLQIAVQANQSILMDKLLHCLPDNIWSDFIKNNPTIAYYLIKKCEEPFLDRCFQKCSEETILSLRNEQEQTILHYMLQEQKLPLFKNLLNRVRDNHAYLSHRDKNGENILSCSDKSTSKELTEEIVNLDTRSLLNIEDEDEYIGISSDTNSPVGSASKTIYSSSQISDNILLQSNPTSSNEGSPRSNQTYWDVGNGLTESTAYDVFDETRSENPNNDLKIFEQI